MVVLFPKIRGSSVAFAWRFTASDYAGIAFSIAPLSDFSFTSLLDTEKFQLFKKSTLVEMMRLHIPAVLNNLILADG